jgi:hypothetical protein
MPWEWTFACLLHCSVHGNSVAVGCPSCGDQDPLPFGLVPASGCVPCQSCEANLLDAPACTGGRPSSRHVIALERDYRAALLGGSSINQTRQFVDDTLRLLDNCLELRPSSGCDSRHPILVSSRRELLGTISQLVLNACPDCDLYERRTRYRKSLKMWNSSLPPLTPEARRSLARASRAWPSVLRRRFDSALAHTTRKSWSYP